MAPSYRFGKGPIVVALAATLRSKATFDKLYADLVKALGQITSPAGDTNFTSDFKTQLLQEQRDHLDRDVFGEGQADQIAAAEGRQRRIVYYDGLKRAMDLARNLGAPNAPVPIEIFWGCGQPRNEVWISWDKVNRSGVTLFVLSTDPASPGQDTNVVAAPFDPHDPAAMVAGAGPALGNRGLYVLRADDDDHGRVGFAPDGKIVIETYKADPTVIGI
jgi:hypothetical protein